MGLLAADPQASDMLGLNSAVLLSEKASCFTDKSNLTGVCVGGKGSVAAFLWQWRAIVVGLILKFLFDVPWVAQTLLCLRVWFPLGPPKVFNMFWVNIHQLSCAKVENKITNKKFLLSSKCEHLSLEVLQIRASCDICFQFQNKYFIVQRWRTIGHWLKLTFYWTVRRFWRLISHCSCRWLT